MLKAVGSSGSGGGGGTPGGTNGQLQYNDSDEFGGTDLVEYDSTNKQIILKPIDSPTAPTAALGSGAGNLSVFDNYQYKVTFLDADGQETLAGAVSNAVDVTDSSTNGKINLTNISVSSYPGVTARKLYRNIAVSSEQFYTLAIINDNSTTVYLDNIGDDDLSISPPIPYNGGIAASIASSADTNINLRPNGRGSFTVGTLYSAPGYNSYYLGVDNTPSPYGTNYVFGADNIVSLYSTHTLGSDNINYASNSSILGPSNILYGIGGCLLAGRNNVVSSAFGGPSAAGAYVMGDQNTVNIGAKSFTVGASNNVGPSGFSFSRSGTTISIDGDRTAYFSDGDSIFFYNFNVTGNTGVYSFVLTISDIAFADGVTTFTVPNWYGPSTTGKCYDGDIAGNGQLVFGVSNTVTGGSSICFGDHNTVSEDSLAVGSNNTVTGSGSAAIGRQGTVEGDGSFLINLGIGGGNTITQNSTFAIMNGVVGIGIVAPTARLHLPAGTDAAATAPLKISPGTNMTVPEEGALEYDGTNLYFTTATGRQNLGAGKSNIALFDHFTDANNTTTTETDLYSDTLAAGQLATNGDKIFADYGGSFSGAVSATQQLKIYFGATAIFDSGALSIGVATPSWDIYVTIIRVSSSVVRCVTSITTSSAALSASSQYVEVTGLTLANTQVLKITGTAAGVGAGSSQITARLGTVSYQGHA